MAFRPRDLRWIVEESTTLSERLGGSVVPGGSGRCAGTAGARLRKWRNRVANGDFARFEKRLRWDGLDVESARRLLGPVRLRHPHRLPDWVGLLDAAAAGTERDTPFDRIVSRRDVLDPHDPQPFEDLLWRLVPVAGRRLLASLGACRDRLSSTALADLARGLLGRLCRTAARTLCLEFDAFRALHSGRLLLDARDPAQDGRRLYRDFIRDMSGNGLAGWLLRYPLLGRLLATGCRQWIAATVELVQRLDRDADSLRTAFALRDRRLEIAGVSPDLSDPHREGRTVCAIRLRSGARLVYKPRSLALDGCFSDLLRQIEDLHPDLALRRPKVLDCGEYGWMEWIDRTPCADADAVERFYRRAGSLTCLAYVLGASDLHADNLIAAGEHPVPVDIECLAGAPLASPRRGGADPVDGGSPPGSVFRTGLPPAARHGMDGVFRIAGGLADPDPQQAPKRSVTDPNTDRMVWRGHSGPREPEPNAPLLDGRRQSAAAHVEPLLDGFRIQYEMLSENRNRLRDAAIERLEREEFRVVLRDTSSYVRILEDALSPQNMASGPDWSIALDILAAPALAADDRPRCWATRTAERCELERLDVPLFVSSLDRPILRSPTGIRLDEPLDGAGYAVSARLGRLSADDLEQQLRLLRSSFAISAVKRRHRVRRVRAARSRGRTARRNQGLVEVHSIIALLKRLALDEETRVTWHGLGRSADDAGRLGPVGIDLFSGTSGVAVFLAAAAAVTGRRDARELAVRVLDPLCERLAGHHTFALDLAADIGIGGATGLGGLIYALVHAGRSLERRACFAAARAAADGITGEAIGADDAPDVLSGTAGALLGLLALHRTTGDRSALGAAIRCGEHLLDRRTTDPRTGLRTWRTLHGRIATGFAHGASGIGCALHRLGNVTGAVAFRRAAAEGWTAERGRLPRRLARGAEPVPAAQDSRAARPWSWCRGAAGMGLARLEAHEDASARSAIAAALEAAPGAGAVEPDGLCCGRLGRADFLLSAGLHLGRRDHHEAAETICHETITRCLARGRFAVGSDEGFQPGLFQGVSGIGYELLRMQAPAAVPSVLAWE